jgi:hypothetical protein
VGLTAVRMIMMESYEAMLSDVNLSLLSLDGLKLRHLAKQARRHITQSTSKIFCLAFSFFYC